MPKPRVGGQLFTGPGNRSAPAVTPDLGAAALLQGLTQGIVRSQDRKARKEEKAADREFRKDLLDDEQEFRSSEAAKRDAADLQRTSFIQSAIDARAEKARVATEIQTELAQSRNRMRNAESAEEMLTAAQRHDRALAEAQAKNVGEADMGVAATHVALADLHIRRLTPEIKRASEALSKVRGSGTPAEGRARIALNKLLDAQEKWTGLKVKGKARIADITSRRSEDAEAREKARLEFHDEVEATESRMSLRREASAYLGQLPDDVQDDAKSAMRESIERNEGGDALRAIFQKFKPGSHGGGQPIEQKEELLKRELEILDVSPEDELWGEAMSAVRGGGKVDKAVELVRARQTDIEQEESKDRQAEAKEQAKRQAVRDTVAKAIKDVGDEMTPADRTDMSVPEYENKRNAIREVALRNLEVSGLTQPEAVKALREYTLSRSHAELLLNYASSYLKRTDPEGYKAELFKLAKRHRLSLGEE